MKNLQNASEFDEYTRGEKDLCVLFTADWCPDCQVIKPILPELEEQFAEGFDFLSVDRDQFLDLCGEHNVFGIPSFILFRRGKEIARFVSTARKTREEIEAFLNSAKSV